MFVFLLLFSSQKQEKNSIQQKNAEKGTDICQLAQMYVFTNSVPIFGVGFKKHLCAENTVKEWFQHFKVAQKRSTFLSQKLVQAWVKNRSKHVAQHSWTNLWLKRMFFFEIFAGFPQSYSVFLVISNHKQCRGAKIFFLAGCRGVRQGFLKKVHFLFLSFMLERAKEKKWKNAKCQLILKTPRQ